MHGITESKLGPVSYDQWLTEHTLRTPNQKTVAIRVKSGPAGRATITRVPSLLGLSNGPISPAGTLQDEKCVANCVEIARKEARGIPRRPKGSGGISVYGQWMIRDGGAIFDRLPSYTKGAYTLTCPGHTEDEIEVWNAGFTELLRVFHRDYVREIKKRVPPNKKDAEALNYWAYVIEEQERGAWHSHHMLPLKVHSADKDFFTIPEIDEFAWSCIHKVYGNYFDQCPSKSFGNLERIRQSVAGYYSKYMSKGTGDHSTNPPPCHWWGMSKELKKQVEEETFDRVYYLDAVDWEEMLYDIMRAGGVQWAYPVLIPADDCPREYWHQFGWVIIQPREFEWVVPDYFERRCGDGPYQLLLFDWEE